MSRSAVPLSSQRSSRTKYYSAKRLCCRKESPLFRWWCRSIGGKVVGISYRRVSNLLYCCLRCLHLRTSQILPTDQASQPHLTAAQEAEEQEQHGLFAGE